MLLRSFCDCCRRSYCEIHRQLWPWCRCWRRSQSRFGPSRINRKANQGLGFLVACRCFRCPRAVLPATNVNHFGDGACCGGAALWLRVGCLRLPCRPQLRPRYGRPWHRCRPRNLSQNPRLSQNRRQPLFWPRQLGSRLP